MNIIDFVVRGEGWDLGLGKDQEGDQERDRYRDQEEGHGKDSIAWC